MSERMRWRPIATAPDSTYVLVWMPNYGINVALLTKHPTGDHWWLRDHGDYAYPTHWMPLPDPPEGGGAHPMTEPRLDRLYNLIANLAHPHGDHRENLLEDEAHDILRELRAEGAALVAAVQQYEHACACSRDWPCEHEERIIAAAETWVARLAGGK